MNDNIQILNKNGDVMSVEGIANVAIADLNKKYLFYTLNEKVDNDLTKIYIAEESDVQGAANPINDEEWDNIRKKMVKISHKEEVEGVTYYSFGENMINVGDAKKLAVTSVAKQAFKEAQTTHTISTNQTETPVVNGTSTFFAQEPVTSQNGDEENGGGQSIFSNPPIPELTNIEQPQNSTVTTGTQASEIPAVPIQNQPEISNVDAVQNPAEEAPAISAAVPVNTDTQVVEQPVIESINNESAQPTSEALVEKLSPQVENVITNASTDNSTISVPEQINNNVQKEIISDEDALKAIEVIQDYIAQEEAA